MTEGGDVKVCNNVTTLLQTRKSYGLLLTAGDVVLVVLRDGRLCPDIIKIDNDAMFVLRVDLLLRFSLLGETHVVPDDVTFHYYYYYQRQSPTETGTSSQQNLRNSPSRWQKVACCKCSSGNCNL